jgi:quinol monooxygenase YgiN
MSQVVVVATYRVPAGGRDGALEALRTLAERTHDEAGCLACALHEDPDDKGVLVLVERWTSSVALENHRLQAYVTGLDHSAFDGEPEMRVLRPVPAGDPMKGTL